MRIATQVALLALAARAALAARDPPAVGSRESIPSREAFLSMIRSSRPATADPQFDCAWRGLAYTYAQQLQPFRSAENFAAIFDGLELGATCNQTFVPPPARPRAPRASAASPTSTLYVDIVRGSDANPGSLAQPLQHVATALALSRSLPRPVEIVLRAGVYRLSAPLVLQPEDSFLTLSAYEGETAVLSGGAVVNTTWAPFRVGAESDFVVIANASTIFGDTPDGVHILNYTRTESWAACQAICATYPGCTSFTWHDSIWPIEYKDTCWLRTDGVWTPTADQDHVAGVNLGPPNVYVADLTGQSIPAGTGPSFVPSLLYSPDGGVSTQRATRARWPNANPELDLYPTGWNPTLSTPGWLPPAPASNTTVIHVPLPDNYPGMFQDFYWGVGGPCERYSPPESYWCQPNGRTGGSTYFVRSPSGLVYSPVVLPNAPYASGGVGAIVDYWRHGHWFSMMTVVDAVNASRSTLSWTYGAFQGAEGDTTGEDWFIENVFEELDAPNEFFWDRAAQKLYFFHNGTGPPPSSWTFEVPVLSTLVLLNGTQANPVRNVTLTGLQFTSAAPTFLAPHGTPSGGDWGLARAGAVFLNGTEWVTIEDSLFTRLDGNAVFINGYNRNATVQRNEFVWIGDTAIAAWGYTDYVNATSGSQPWGNQILSNLCHELGHFEKQSSCYFQATSALSNVQGNIFFNGPRAAINFNDGMGGGSIVQENLVWNMCRETQDHGPFNSWDRVPYLTQILNGTTTPWPAYNHVVSNFMVANYGSNGGCVDNDDGSRRYEISGNFFVYGGHKSDFDGEQKVSTNNINAFSNVYGPTCVLIAGLPQVGFNEGYSNCTCILGAADQLYLNVAGPCNAADPSSVALTVSNNRVYAPNAQALVNCGKQYNFTEWMALGVDTGSTIADLPSNDEIIQWARDLLQIQAP